MYDSTMMDEASSLDCCFALSYRDSLEDKEYPQGYIKYSAETSNSIDHLETNYEDIGRISLCGNVTYMKALLLKEGL